MHDVGKLHNIPADVKEKLHHLPPGYTRASFLDDTTRHRMLANGWHWGGARRLLAILLVLTSGHHGGSGANPEPGRSAIRCMVEQFGGGPAPMGPPPRLRPEVDLPKDDPLAHWNMSADITHCTVARRPEEPALERVLTLWSTGATTSVASDAWSWRRCARWSTTPRRTQRPG